MSKEKEIEMEALFLINDLSKGEVTLSRSVREHIKDKAEEYYVKKGYNQAKKEEAEKIALAKKRIDILSNQRNINMFSNTNCCEVFKKVLNECFPISECTKANKENVGLNAKGESEGFVKADSSNCYPSDKLNNSSQVSAQQYNCKKHNIPRDKCKECKGIATYNEKVQGK